jgi:hypothetical protein
VGIAYVAGYILYLAAWLVYARRHRFLAVSAGTAIMWLGGAALVAVVSAWFWEPRPVDVSSAAIVLATVAIFSVAAARSSERDAIVLLLKQLVRRGPPGRVEK